MSILKMQSKL